MKNKDKNVEIDAPKKQNMKKVIKDFKKGDKLMKNVGITVTIFGSARIKEWQKEYKQAAKMAFMLAESGINVATGGGKGIMEAGNKGAYKSNNAESIGLSIELPFEQQENKYVDRQQKFDFFFSRKVMLVKYSKAYIVFPGGYGTMDELFETLTLMQTGKIPRSTVYLVGIKFYAPLMDFIYKSLLRKGVISDEDETMVKLTDSLEYVLKDIKKNNNIK
jgi:hypothetical protein